MLKNFCHSMLPENGQPYWNFPTGSKKCYLRMDSVFNQGGPQAKEMSHSIVYTVKLRQVSIHFKATPEESWGNAKITTYFYCIKVLYTQDLRNLRICLWHTRKNHMNYCPVSKFNARLCIFSFAVQLVWNLGTSKLVKYGKQYNRNINVSVISTTEKYRQQYNNVNTARAAFLP